MRRSAATRFLQRADVPLSLESRPIPPVSDRPPERAHTQVVSRPAVVLHVPDFYNLYHTLFDLLLPLYHTVAKAGVIPPDLELVIAHDPRLTSAMPWVSPLRTLAPTKCALPLLPRTLHLVLRSSGHLHWSRWAVMPSTASASKCLLTPVATNSSPTSLRSPGTRFGPLSPPHPAHTHTRTQAQADAADSHPPADTVARTPTQQTRSCAPTRDDARGISPAGCFRLRSLKSATGLALASHRARSSWSATQQRHSAPGEEPPSFRMPTRRVPRSGPARATAGEGS